MRITEVSTIDNDIIQVDKVNLQIEPREHTLHESLESCRCVALAEGHNCKAKEPLMCDKHSLVNVPRVHLYLPIPRI